MFTNNVFGASADETSRLRRLVNALPNSRHNILFHAKLNHHILSTLGNMESSKYEVEGGIHNSKISITLLSWRRYCP